VADRREKPTPPPVRGPNDVRNLENWQQAIHHLSGQPLPPAYAFTRGVG